MIVEVVSGAEHRDDFQVLVPTFLVAERLTVYPSCNVCYLHYRNEHGDVYHHYSFQRTIPVFQITGYGGFSIDLLAVESSDSQYSKLSDTGVPRTALRLTSVLSSDNSPLVCNLWLRQRISPVFSLMSTTNLLDFLGFRDDYPLGPHDERQDGEVIY